MVRSPEGDRSPPGLSQTVEGFMTEKHGVLPTPVDGAGAKVVLSVKDRLVIHGLMPAEAKMIEIAIAKGIVSKFQIGREESERIGLKIENGLYNWDPDKAEDKEIELTRTEVDFLQGRITFLDNAGKMNLALFDLSKILQRL
jgi:hypothetical protein